MANDDAPALEPPAPSSRATHQLVLKNAMLLVVAKVLATPISILVNAVTARYLGPEAYSYVYLASTFVGFGMLFVQFGQDGTIPAMVARNRSRAGQLLGTALAWRVVLSLAVYALIALGCVVLDYELEFQQVLALVMAGALFNAITSACQDTIRGFERTDVDAVTSVGAPLLGAAVTIPILLLGGKLKSVLIGDIVCAVLILAVVSRVLKPVGVGALAVEKETARTLLREGYPFLFFSLAMALQPNIDAVFLSKLAPAEVVGWHAAARKLIGLLVFPASALITALYPVLCRLWVENQDAYRNTTSSALRSAILLVIPVTFGCALFPDIGIRIFSREKFGPAENNLQFLSVFIFLVYFSMPLGSALLAAGRARAWSVVQAVCVVVNLIVNPIMVPWFQKHWGNGGLGVCTANVITEALIVAFGIWLVPRGVFTRAVFKTLALSLFAGGAMTAVAWLLRDLSSFVAAPLALGAYAIAMWVTGGFNKEQLQTIREIVARKARR